MNSDALLDAASGYLFLGMPDECLEELGQVNFATLCTERYMVLKLAAQTSKRDWVEAYVTARLLKARFPDSELAYVAGATCLIEMARYLEAVELLLEGPSSLRRKAMTHLQIAYCEFKMGNEYAAAYCLEEARRIDPELTAQAQPHVAPAPVGLTALDEAVVAEGCL